MIFWDWLNSNSGAVNAILVAILVVITGIYAYQTHRQVRESKAYREMATRPFLSVTIELHEIHFNIINFRVENFGGGPARNIRLRPSREFRAGGDAPLSKLGLFTNGMTYLGPGRKIESVLGSAIEIYQEPKQEPLTVSAEYMGVTDKKFKEEFVIDFAAFENLTWAGTAPLQTIAKSIEALQKSIGNLSYGMKKLSVLVYSQDDLDAESTAWNLSRKLRRVSPDGRNEIENLIDHEISRLSTKPVPPLQSGEGE